MRASVRESPARSASRQAMPSGSSSLIWRSACVVGDSRSMLSRARGWKRRHSSPNRRSRREGTWTVNDSGSTAWSTATTTYTEPISASRISPTCEPITGRGGPPELSAYVSWPGTGDAGCGPGCGPVESPL